MVLIVTLIVTKYFRGTMGTLLLMVLTVIVLVGQTLQGINCMTKVSSTKDLVQSHWIVFNLCNTDFGHRWQVEVLRWIIGSSSGTGGCVGSY